MLWGALRNHRIDGFGFRRQTSIGPYFADFVCLARKIVIEADGRTHEAADARIRRRKRCVVPTRGISRTAFLRRTCDRRIADRHRAHSRGALRDMTPKTLGHTPRDFGPRVKLIRFTQVEFPLSFVERRAASAPLLREAGKVAHRASKDARLSTGYGAGWGVESRERSTQARRDGRANWPSSQRRPIPHPAFGHLPQQAGEGIAPPFEMCECSSGEAGEGVRDLQLADQSMRMARHAPNLGRHGSRSWGRKTSSPRGGPTSSWSITSRRSTRRSSSRSSTRRRCSRSTPPALRAGRRGSFFDSPTRACSIPPGRSRPRARPRGRGGRRLAVFLDSQAAITGRSMKTYDAAALIAEKSEALVTPVHLAGAERTFFSRISAAYVGGVSSESDGDNPAAAPARNAGGLARPGEAAGRRRGALRHDVGLRSSRRHSPDGVRGVRGIGEGARPFARGGRGSAERRLTLRAFRIGVGVLARKIAAISAPGETIGVMLPNATAPR